MEQTVYGDILFFVNFCMDFQCLFLSGKLLHRPFPLLRGVLFSALGALYACAALFLQVSGVVAFLADCSVCFLMCLGVFLTREGGVRSVLAPFALYFGVSMAVGGVMSGIAALLSHIETPMGEGTEDMSSGAFFVLATLGGVATFLWGRMCQRRAKGKRAKLKLFYGGQQLSVHSMVDTANLLRDPIGGRPVILLDRRAARELLPRELLDALCHGERAVAALPYELARRVRWIPTATATGSGLLLAIEPDRAVLDAGRGATEVEVLLTPVSLTVADREVKALLPAELIME